MVTIQPQRVAVTTELAGRTSAFLVAEVRPQVSGIIQERRFTEGSDVKAGDVLYRIDPATYQAALASAQAALAKAGAAHASAKAALAGAQAARASVEAALNRAQTNAVPRRLKAERYAELVAINAVSRQDADDATAAVQQAESEIKSAEAAVAGTAADIARGEAAVQLAEAEIAGAEAALEAARVNRSRTEVTAPVSGRIGRSAVTTGSLVTANQAAALATIQQLDPVYVDVTESSSNLLRLRQNLSSGRLTQGGAGQAVVRLVLENGAPYPLEGTLKFSDVTVQPGTGSVTLRTVFPNPEQLLLPGMFVRAVVQEGVNESAHPRAAAGRLPQPEGRARGHGGRRGREGRGPPPADRPRHRRPVAGRGRARGGRPRHPRGAAAGPAGHAGEGGALRRDGRARRARRRRPAAAAGK